MKAVLDTCVLYPPILREILVGVAQKGGYLPIWSDGILEEWRHIAARDGGENAMIVGSEIARLGAVFPDARVVVSPADLADLYLPDPHDLHVLAAGRVSAAAVIVTANLRDFPGRELAPFGLKACHPDAFLVDLWITDAALIGQVVAAVLAEARRLSGRDIDQKALLKRARLPRLAKALARA